MMLVKVGTSGYNYFWNEGKPNPFQWYLSKGFKTVEINATFYSFPSNSWIKIWEKAPEDFEFSVKVHRSITHYSKLKGKALILWERFSSLFKSIKVSFWLFQLPPSFSYKNFDNLKNFVDNLEDKEKMVFEFREEGWWKHIKEVKKLGVIFCSLDAPDLPMDIIPCNGTIYLRLHGRTSWYSHIYTDEELKELVKRIKKLKPKKVYIYLNNNHGMLPNALNLIQLLK